MAFPVFLYWGFVGLEPCVILSTPLLKMNHHTPPCHTARFQQTRTTKTRAFTVGAELIQGCRLFVCSLHLLHNSVVSYIMTGHVWQQHLKYGRFKNKPICHAKYSDWEQWNSNTLWSSEMMESVWVLRRNESCWDVYITEMGFFFRRRGASKDNPGLRWSDVCFTGMMLLGWAGFLLWFLGEKEAIWSERKLKWLQVQGKSIQRKSHSESSQHLCPHWAIWPRLWAIFGYPRRKIKIAGETRRYFRSWH